MSDRWFDPEVDDIFRGEPELAELADRVRASRPQPALDPRFQGQLRAQLMAEAQTVLSGNRPRVAQRASLRRRRRFIPSLRAMGWTGGAAGIALAAATVLTVLNTHPQDHTNFSWRSALAQNPSVSPTDAITVSFNQPMDESAVVQGIHIDPAAAYTTAWQGNQLTIKPDHPLAANTPYTVTIDHSAARTADGQTAPQDITITFGTAPTPTPQAGPQVPPMLLAGVGAGSANAQLVFTHAGGVIVSSAPAPQPSGSASPSSSPTAAASESATPTEGGNALVAYAADGTATVLDVHGATAIALTADGTRLLAAIPDGAGTDLVAMRPDGSHRASLYSDPQSIDAAGWRADGAAVFADSSQLAVLGKDGKPAQLAPRSSGDSVVIGGGRFATMGTSLVSLSDGSSRTLTGATATALSGDGSTVAWLTGGSGGAQSLQISPTDHDSPSTIALPGSLTGLSSLSLDAAADRIALIAGGQLVVASLPSGQLLADGPSATSLALSADGSRLLTVGAGDEIFSGSVPEASGTITAAGVPPAADQALQSFLAAQVKGDSTALRALAASNVDTGATPNHLGRFNVITETVEGREVTAMVRLLVDPAAGSSQAGQAAGERLVLDPATGGYEVTALQIGKLAPLPKGPHVLHAAITPGASGPVLSITFDSDLDRGSVAAAVQLSGLAGLGTPAVSYDDTTRTVTVPLPATASGRLMLTVSTALRDINGTPLANPFEVTLPL